jgi:hypothetical protein
VDRTRIVAGAFNRSDRLDVPVKLHAAPMERPFSLMAVRDIFVSAR